MGNRNDIERGLAAETSPGALAASEAASGALAAAVASVSGSAAQG